MTESRVPPTLVPLPETCANSIPEGLSPPPNSYIEALVSQGDGSLGWDFWEVTGFGRGHEGGVPMVTGVPSLEGEERPELRFSLHPVSTQGGSYL